MTESRPARPVQVTLAGWLVVGGSVLVVLLAFSRVASLHSLDTQEAIERFLKSWPGDDAGLSVQGAQTLLRIASMVAAACGAATAILGWQVLQRSKGARVALSLLAAPLFVTGFTSGGLASAVVTAAIVTLWFQPARDWFNGISQPAPSPARPERPAPPASGRSPLLDLPPPTAPPLYPTAYAAGSGPAAASAAARPRSVVWACALTWASTAAVFVVFATNLLQLAIDPDELLDTMRRQDPELSMSDADLTRLMAIVLAAFVVWTLVAAVLAVLVWRRVAPASVALTVSAVLACLTVLPVVVCIPTVVLLQREESRAWLRGSA